MGNRNSEVLLSQDLWPAIKRLPRGRNPIRAAIAFYSKDLLRLQSGDLLVINASDKAISSGITSGTELLTLHKRGVRIHGVEWLHAKVISIGSKAVIGSANASENSEKRLKEAAVITGSFRIRTQVIGFIEATAASVEPMTIKEATRLANITVVRDDLSFKARPREQPTEKQNLWWISTGPLSKLLEQRERKDVLNGIQEAREAVGESQWAWDVLRYSPSDRDGKRLKVGDIVFQAYSEPVGDSRTTQVHSAATVIYVKRTEKWVRFYPRSNYSRWKTVALPDAYRTLGKVTEKPPSASTTRKLCDDEFVALEDMFSRRKTS